MPLQARIFALAGLRLFIDFFLSKINEPRAIHTRGFLLTGYVDSYSNNYLKETENDTTRFIPNQKRPEY